MAGAIYLAGLLVVAGLVPWLLSGALDDRRSSASQEHRLWVCVLLVLALIYGGLAVAPELAAALRQQNLLVTASVAAMVGFAVVIAGFWWHTRPGVLEVAVALGIAAVAAVAMLRISIVEERTHLFEYGLLALLIHQALLCRKAAGRWTPPPASTAIIATALLGWLDEMLQAALPGRVYDLRDAATNALAGVYTVTAATLLARLRRRR